MISRWVRTWSGRVLQPELALAANLGVSPNLLTISGLGIFVSAAFVLAVGQMELGGVLLIIGGLLDGLDGHLARFLDRETQVGAFLDSICDHLGDFSIYLSFLSLALQTDDRLQIVLIFFALFGSVFGSHVRSRAGMLGIETKTVGVFTRFERIMTLILGIFTHQITMALLILAVANNIVALQRISFTFALSRVSIAR